MKRCVMLAGIVVVVTACAPTLPTTVVERGEPVTDGGLTMTVGDAELMWPISDDYPWGEWLVVDLQIESGDEGAWFNPLNQQLFIDGDEFRPSAGAGEAVSRKTVSGASLLPNTDADVTLAFYVKDADYSTDSTVQLVLHGDVDSPGVVVGLPGEALALPPKSG